MRFGKRRPESAADTLRPFLLGDQGLYDYPPNTAQGEPWATFLRARQAAVAGDRGTAVKAWLGIARDPDTEPRCVLQAWTFLRAYGEVPAEDEATVVQGVVCEVAGPGGHDVLAAYRDGTVRLLGRTGRATVVETPLPEALAVVEVARPLGRVIGVWDKPALPPLPAGHSRMLLLTPGGFRFGQGPNDLLWRDPPASAVLTVAAYLMRRVVDLS